MTNENTPPNEKTPQSFKLPLIACDVFRALPTPQEKAEFAGAVFEYAKKGQATPPKSFAAASLFEMVKEQLDLLRAKKERLSAVRSDVGKIGGAKWAELCAQARKLQAGANPIEGAKKVPQTKEEQKAKHAGLMATLRKDPAFREKENARRRELRKQAREAREAKEAGQAEAQK